MSEHFDVVVIGAGPAGQKAAVQGAKAGRRVLLIERESAVGGECVHRGTIPSKTLRESAVYFAGLKQRATGLVDAGLGRETTVRSLMKRLDGVLASHERYMSEQMARNGIEFWQGRAKFRSQHDIEVGGVHRDKRSVRADIVVIATGSRPRKPPEIPIDHDHVLDSDSILSMIYLPSSLLVLGAGIVACEFATIFQSLGVAVTIVDKGERLLPFLDPELTDAVRARFEREGGRLVARAAAASVSLDGLGRVETTLTNGEIVHAEKVLVALGRTASVAALDLDAAGIALDERGFIAVDAHCRTNVPHIYAVGDVIGPPALATSSMEQGRRAMRHALGLETGTSRAPIPVGIYTIPEMACIGATEDEARKRDGGAVVGRAQFRELARGQINGTADGVLKLVADREGRKLLGAHIVGEGATELIHLAQMALVGGMEVDVFVDNIFNFPTLAEAYRVAALDVVGQRSRVSRAA